MIEEKEARKIMSDFPTEAVIILYAISAYHQKWNFTAWTRDVLSKRGISLADMQQFDNDFRGFYDDLLNQPDL